MHCTSTLEGHNEKLLIAASLAKNGYFHFFHLLLLTLKRLSVLLGVGWFCWFVFALFFCFFVWLGLFFFFKMRNRSIQVDNTISELL